MKLKLGSQSNRTTTDSTNSEVELLHSEVELNFVK
jgi:hypothetical protein